MKVMAVSDMHGNLEGLDPSGADIVIVAGDFGIMKGWGMWHMNDQVKWINKRFVPWCAAYPGIKFCVVPGNHDLFAQHPELPTKLEWHGNVHFLVDAIAEIKGLRIAGMPWVPPINGSWAFEARDEGDMARHLDWVPEGVDVLVTHSPPRLDGQFVDWSLQTGRGPFGSVALAQAIARIKPRYLFCGHIHSGDHSTINVVHDGGLTKVCNVSRVDEDYRIAYEPTWVDISPSPSMLGK